MTAPTDTTGDVRLAATITPTVDAWRAPTVNAELRLALLEDLTAQARGRGRELRDNVRLELRHLRRHQWVDTETHTRREWLEQTVAEDADLVEVTASVGAYRP